MLKKIKNFLRKRLSRRTILFYHRLQAVAANVYYGFPARGMTVFGVTGTKGKTTTSYFTASILREAGFTVGVCTTVSFSIGDKTWVNDKNMSSLPPFELFKLLRDMKEARCDALVLETTSHALDQFRTWGVPYRFVGLTNITHDHLDYHATWNEYQAAKLKLFKWGGLKAAVANACDPSGTLFLTETTAPRKWSYAVDGESRLAAATDYLFAEKVSSNPGGTSFTLTTDQESARVTLQVPGRFNIENALCAAALCLNLNLKLGTIVAGLQNMPSVPGRLERIESRKGFTVMVDYAHTPDSLEKLYSSLRPDVRGRMIAVLGSCGDRDKTKRPIMGALAARFCDYVFVTDEEPYTEDPLAIIEEVAKGVPRGRPLFQGKHQHERPVLKKGDESGENIWWWKVTDRREAISKAIDMCKMDDLVLVTGMGAQNYKVVGDAHLPWNDHTVVEELLAEKKLL